MSPRRKTLRLSDVEYNVMCFGKLAYLGVELEKGYKC